MLVSFTDYWAENPPAHQVLAAAFLNRTQKKQGDLLDLLHFSESA